MSDLAGATGAASETLVVVKGREFRVGVLSVRAAGKIQDWLNRQAPPNSVAQLKADGLLDPSIPAEIQRGLIAEAREEERSWPPQVASQTILAFAELFRLPGGAEELALRALEQAESRRGDGRLNEAEIREHVAEMDTNQLAEVAQAAMGVDHSASVDRARPEIVVLGRENLHGLAHYVLSALGLEAAPEAVRAACDAIPLEQVGTRIMLHLAEGRAEAPNAAAPSPGSTRARRSSA